MVTQFTQYEHHGNTVWVDESQKGNHRDVCLCNKCAKFKPGTAWNCPIAQQNYEMCIEHGLVTPVWECPKFDHSQKSIYLICPVRNCDDETRAKMDVYVEKLENEGHKVHYPPRDVKQVDTNAHAICQAHVRAMRDVDEVHTWWDEESKGSHFDFGMAYMLHWISSGNIKFVLANPSEAVDPRSYGGYYKYLTAEPEFEWKLES